MNVFTSTAFHLHFHVNVSELPENNPKPLLCVKVLLRNIMTWNRNKYENLMYVNL